MYKIVLKSLGSTTGLTSWLKQFKEIDNSLLIEVDLDNSSFITKSFTASDKALVRRSIISFENAGLELDNVYIGKALEKPILPISSESEIDENISLIFKQKIKVGIFMILNKFIDVVNTFSTTDYEFIINVEENRETGNIDFQAVDIEFISKSLKMRVKCGNISEFTFITDDMFFNNIYVADKPIEFHISAETIKNLLSVSSVFSIDAKKDIIKFYTHKVDGHLGLYAQDVTNNSYDYLLGYTEESNIETELKVFLSKFIVATKGSSENMVILLSSSYANRLLIDSEDRKTNTVISVIKE